jgi:hypothetical protein
MAGTSIKQIFDDRLHEHRVKRLSYLLRAFMALTETGHGPAVWMELSAEAVGPLDKRRLFTEAGYRESIVTLYTEMIEANLFDRLAR